MFKIVRIRDMMLSMFLNLANLANREQDFHDEHDFQD